MKSRSAAVAALVVVLGLLGASCGGGTSVAVEKVNADIGMVPNENGFSFANFGAQATPEVFDGSDLAQMFGEQACVDGRTDPCAPTTEAASWARMVNESRASGHCEGLAVQASARYAAKADPVTVKLFNKGDVTHGIMRAFATQFLPEVQDATNEWAKKSLAEKVNELARSLKAGNAEYTLGIYSEEGGHAVLPYAIQFTEDDLAVIKVYDSNWPGAERYVVVDLKAEKWFFSFNGQNPKTDECAWTGGARDLDITPMTKRTSGTCPFCGDKSTVAKTVLLIRSVDDAWSVKTKNGTFSPSSGEEVQGISGKAIRSATCGKVVKIPEFVLLADQPDLELELPNTTSAYVSNGTSMVEIKTKGKKPRKPVIISGNTITVTDPTTELTVANQNLAVKVVADSSVITLDEAKITVDVTVGGEQQQVVVEPEKPQVAIDTTGGTVQETTTNLGLSEVAAPLPAELTPPEVKGDLPPVTERDLSNTAYVAKLAAEATDLRNSVIPTTTTTTTTTTVAATTTAVATTVPTKKSTTSTTTASTVSTSAPSSATTTIQTTQSTAVSSATTSPTKSTTSATTTTTDPPMTGGGQATTTTTRATTTTAAATTTTTVPMATLKIQVNINNPSLIVDIGWAASDWDQNWNKWSCSGSSGCDNATKSVPLNDFIYVRIRNSAGNYIDYSPSSTGTTYISSNDFYSTSGIGDSRRCGPNWVGWANNTCVLSVDP